MRRTVCAMLAVAAAVAIPSIGRAQDTFTGFGSTSFMDGVVNNIRMDSLRRHMLDLDDPATERSPAANRAAKAVPPARSAKPAAASTAARMTTYRASPAVSVRVREQFLRWIGKTTSAAGEAEMRRVMTQQDVLALWATQMRADGLRPGDMADALTAYWVQNWQMANAVETTRPAQVRAVRAQVAAGMADNQLNDAQRQEMSEVWIYNQFVQGSAWIDAGQRGDRDLQRKLGDASVARFRGEMRVDLRKLQLTDAGFAPR